MRASGKGSGVQEQKRWGGRKLKGVKLVLGMQRSVVDVSGNSASSSCVPGFMAFGVVGFGSSSHDQ